MAVAPTKISLRLLINKDTNNLLFAEAGKDFVDFLFSLLVLPIGTVINILTQQNMVAMGGLGQLYQSLALLNPTYMKSESYKNLLLSPPVPSSISPPSSLLQIPNQSFYRCSYCGDNANYTNIPGILCPHCQQQMNSPMKLIASTTVPALLQLPNQSDTSSKSFYRCACSRGDNPHYTNIQGRLCPVCLHQMNTPMKFIASTTSQVKEGYVKEIITYMVMDDLSVSPMSTISSITLLSKFQVKDVGVLEERTVSVGMDEGIKILKTCLHSSTILSDVFLEKKIVKSESKPGLTSKTSA